MILKPKPIKIWKPIIECPSCRKTVKKDNTLKILERKHNRLTGRQFILCVKCGHKFLKNELKWSDIDTETKLGTDKTLKNKLNIIHNR